MHIDRCINNEWIPMFKDSMIITVSGSFIILRNRWARKSTGGENSQSFISVPMYPDMPATFQSSFVIPLLGQL